MPPLVNTQPCIMLKNSLAPLVNTQLCIMLKNSLASKVFITLLSQRS